MVDRSFVIKKNLITYSSTDNDVPSKYHCKPSIEWHDVSYLHKYCCAPTDLEPVKEYVPVDNPPPYTEHDIHKLALKAAAQNDHLDQHEVKTLGRRFKERKDIAATETKVTR